MDFPNRIELTFFIRSTLSLNAPSLTQNENRSSLQGSSNLSLANALMGMHVTPAFFAIQLITCQSTLFFGSPSAVINFGSTSPLSINASKILLTSAVAKKLPSGGIAVMPAFSINCYTGVQCRPHTQPVRILHTCHTYAHEQTHRQTHAHAHAHT